MSRNGVGPFYRIKKIVYSKYYLEIKLSYHTSRQRLEGTQHIEEEKKTNKKRKKKNIQYDTDHMNPSLVFHKTLTFNLTN